MVPYFYVLSSSGNKFFQSDDMSVWSRIQAEEIKKEFLVCLKERITLSFI